MKLDKLAKYSLIAISLSLCVGFSGNTTGGAVFAFGFGKSAQKQATEQTGSITTTTTVSATTTPEIDAAAKRVDVTKTNLDLARKRLDAAKALVKAAEAEYKAAKTDKDALVLNTQAQQLADASGLPKNGENAPANATTPAGLGGAPVATSPIYSSSESTIDYSGSGAGSNAGTAMPNIR